MIEETLLEAEEKMEKAVEVAKEDFAGIRTGPGQRRACSTSSWSTTTAPRPRCSSWRRSRPPRPAPSSSRPFDKSAMPEIEKTLRDSDLGVNPSNDGNIIRCVLPQLTEERRKDYIKLARAQGRGRQGVDPQHPPQGQGRAGQAGQGRRRRRGRRHRGEKELDATTKKYVDTVDELLKGKEAELLEV